MEVTKNGGKHSKKNEVDDGTSLKQAFLPFALKKKVEVDTIEETMDQIKNDNLSESKENSPNKNNVSNNIQNSQLKLNSSGKMELGDFLKYANSVSQSSQKEEGDVMEQ